MARIDLINVSKQFQVQRAGVAGSAPMTAAQQAQADAAGERQRLFAIQKLNLTIPHSKVMVILGPSGCGKSTLLQMIAGLMEPDAGEIHFDGANMADVPPGDRKIGMVFQNYALYPQYSSQRNIMSYFSFRKRTPELNKEAEEKYRRTSELMGVDLEYLLNKKPGRLSGGEQQRVAIARCITRDPQLFLLDEPFSNLDAKLREKYRVQLKRLLRAFEITTAYVTHDQREALSLADLIAIMNIGRIEQVGIPREIYNWPANIFVAEFLFFETDAPAINLVEGEKVSREFEDKVIGVRPEDVHLFSAPTESGLQGTITDIRPNPINGTVLLSISLGNQELAVRLPANAAYTLQAPVWLRFEKYHLFDKKSGQRVRTQVES
jgi:multiple sugar transport system ATP-binding protein